MSEHLQSRALLIALALAGGCEQRGWDLDGGDEIVVGQAFVEQRGCPTCHQSQSAADGVLSGKATPMPGTTEYAGNLTPDPLTGLGAWADIEVVRAMRYGLDRDDQEMCPSMPRWNGLDADGGADPTHPLLTDLEADAIVAYLRSLPAVVRRDIPPSVCPPIKDPPADFVSPPLDFLSAPPDLSVRPDLAAPRDLAAPGQDLAAPDLGADGAPADAGAGHG